MTKYWYKVLLAILNGNFRFCDITTINTECEATNVPIDNFDPIFIPNLDKKKNKCISQGDNDSISNFKRS